MTATRLLLSLFIWEIGSLTNPNIDSNPIVEFQKVMEKGKSSKNINKNINKNTIMEQGISTKTSKNIKKYMQLHQEISKNIKIQNISKHYGTNKFDHIPTAERSLAKNVCKNIFNLSELNK